MAFSGVLEGALRVSDGVLEGFRSSEAGSQDVLKNVRRVSKALYRRFRWNLRISGALHGVQRDFRETLESFQEVSKNFRRVLEAKRKRFLGFLGVSSAYESNSGSFRGFSVDFQYITEVFSGDSVGPR